MTSRGSRTSSSNTGQTAAVNAEEERNETAANAEGREDAEDQLDVSEEYMKWKNETGDVLGRLDLLRRGLDDRTEQVRGAGTVDELCQNADDVEAARSEIETVRRMLRGTEKYVVEDMSSSLEALRHSLASYSEATLEKLQNEIYRGKEPSSPSTRHTTVVVPVVSVCYVFIGSVYH